MLEFIKWLVVSLCALLLLVVIVAHAETPCDEWANFAKIVTYKGRDAGLSRDDVKASAVTNSPNHTEDQTALKYIDYVYDNPDVSAKNIWIEVYKQCGMI